MCNQLLLLLLLLVRVRVMNGHMGWRRHSPPLSACCPVSVPAQRQQRHAQFVTQTQSLSAPKKLVCSCSSSSSSTCGTRGSSRSGSSSASGSISSRGRSRNRVCTLFLIPIPCTVMLFPILSSRVAGEISRLDSTRLACHASDSVCGLCMRLS